MGFLGARRFQGRQVIFQGDVEKIPQEHPQSYGSGECVALVQALTDVGHTSRWLPGPKVMDLSFLPIGTVIANFEYRNGAWRYGNRHGFHAAIYAGGLDCTGFNELGQWTHRHGNQVQIRRVVARGGKWAAACDDADQFYVVMV